MKINKGIYNYGFGSSNVNFYSLVNVKLSLLIKEFVKINSTFYLIEKNIIFHFIYKKKKKYSTSNNNVALQYLLQCNRNFSYQQKNKSIKYKSESIRYNYNNFQPFQFTSKFTIQKFFTLKVAKFKDVLDV